jgi:hypothetical protein
VVEKFIFAPDVACVDVDVALTSAAELTDEPKRRENHPEPAPEPEPEPEDPECDFVCFDLVVGTIWDSELRLGFFNIDLGEFLGGEPVIRSLPAPVLLLPPLLRSLMAAAAEPVLVPAGAGVTVDDPICARLDEPEEDGEC